MYFFGRLYFTLLRFHSFEEVCALMQNIDGGWLNESNDENECERRSASRDLGGRGEEDEVPPIYLST